MARRRRFVSISTKVNALIILALGAGIGLLTFYLGRELFTTIESASQEGLEQQSDLLFEAIAQLMLPGEAAIAVDFIDAVQTINPSYEIHVLRPNGNEAFMDNETVREINDRLGRQAFALKPDPQEPTYRVQDERFDRAVGPDAETVTFAVEEEGRRFYRIYRPLPNMQECVVCHGTSGNVRGVIDIRNDVTARVERQRNVVILAGSAFAAAVIILSVVLTQFLRRSVVRPIRSIGDVCRAVTNGDFSVRSDVQKRDEIGELGGTVNDMVVGLRERYELGKFVSSSTIAAIGEGHVGQRVTAALLFSDIRGFTSFSEGRDSDEVVSNLNEVLNTQSEIIQEHNGDIDKYVGDEVVALFLGENASGHACRAAVDIQRHFAELPEDAFKGLRVGIGINLGEVILGMIGSERRADYTVIGDAVNTAARLCNAAKRGEILVSRPTRDGAAEIEDLTFDGPYKLSVKGKTSPLVVYKLNA